MVIIYNKFKERSKINTLVKSINNQHVLVYRVYLYIHLNTLKSGLETR